MDKDARSCLSGKSRGRRKNESVDWEEVDGVGSMLLSRR
jgi:hypothetical protein